MLAALWNIEPFRKNFSVSWHVGVDPILWNCVGSRSYDLKKNLDKTTEAELICYPPLIQMQDAGLQHVCLDLQHEDALRRQSPRCRNVWRREESDVVEASRAHICQSIGGSIYQGYKHCLSHVDESYEKQRGNVHMCIGVWLEIGCSGCKGGWVQLPVVTSGCRGRAQFFSWNQKINLLYLLSFFYCIFFLSSSLGERNFFLEIEK